MKHKLNGTEKVAHHYPASTINSNEAPITASNYKPALTPSLNVELKMHQFKPSELGLDCPLKIVNSIVAGVISYEEGYKVHGHNKRIASLHC